LQFSVAVDVDVAVSHCLAGFSSFSCCNFHKFHELCMCAVSKNNIYLANVAFQMPQQQHQQQQQHVTRPHIRERIENSELLDPSVSPI